MEGLVLFLIALVIIGSLSFIVLSANNSNNNNILKKENQNKILEFSTFTSAICETKEKVVNCRDEVFVDCNGAVSKASDIEECNGLNIEVPKATGSATFGKDWKDPRNI